MTSDNNTLPDTSPAAVLAMTRNLRTNGYELAARMMEAIAAGAPASPVSTVEQGEAVKRLRDAIEGECSGVWISEKQAIAVLAHLNLPAPAAGDARAVIQAAVNSIERPRGLTDKQWEFVKAGARLVVRCVNALSAQRQGDA